MADEKYINFIANFDDWVSIKKLKIEPETDAKMIMEFLASLGISIDAKIEQNLGKIVDLSKVDAAIAELELGKKDTAKALESIGSRKVSSVIKEITEGLGLQKNETKEMQEFCKVYAMKKALKQCGLQVDFSEIKIPGMKKAKKKKV